MNPFYIDMSMSPNFCITIHIITLQRIYIIQEMQTSEIKFVHTNIVARDWKKLALFYENVFGCMPLLPERNLSGQWIDDATALEGVHIRGIHLRLPGYGNMGPTLEIFQYDKLESAHSPIINRPGLAHLAFSVEKVDELLKKLLAEGGELLGKVVTTTIKGAGIIKFVYTKDPEGNLIELQNWEK
jgi:predicted enzyme related to lactoylglutathione lyase